jgi:hypothetical protein
MSAVMTLLQCDAQAEKHQNATHRYDDLISDVEELLSKEPRFRTDVDVTVLNFTMRSDTLLRVAPPVHLKGGVLAYDAHWPSATCSPSAGKASTEEDAVCEGERMGL